MLALYRCDRQADALQAYRDARRALADELGIEPGERLRELEQAILTQDPRLDLAPGGRPGGTRAGDAARSSAVSASSPSSPPASTTRSRAAAACACWSASRGSARAGSRRS